MQGGDNAYVNPSGTYTNFAQGGLKSTGSPMDVALEGKGFFEIGTPEGVRWTRNGSLQIDNNGRLVTKEGYPVLREGNGDPAQRAITLSGRNVTISQSGEVFDGGNNLGKLAVMEFQNPDDLQKVGNSNYTLKANASSVPVASRDSRIHQGYVETSNVNVVDDRHDLGQPRFRSHPTSHQGARPDG
jgi:flagellar basal-body rod protein FlgG